MLSPPFKGLFKLLKPPQRLTTLLRITALSKQLLASLHSAQSTMAEIGNVFSLLHQINLDFNQKSNFGKDEVKEKLYFCLQNSFSCWSEVTHSQLKYIDLHLNRYFEYHNAETSQMSEVKSHQKWQKLTPA